MAEKNENLRFIGKIRKFESANGEFKKILIDNPYPAKEDGSANPYYKGNLLWFDAQTGKYYTVKQLAIKGVSAQAIERGDTASIAIDISSTYHVIETPEN